MQRSRAPEPRLLLATGSRRRTRLLIVRLLLKSPSKILELVHHLCHLTLARLPELLGKLIHVDDNPLAKGCDLFVAF